MNLNYKHERPLFIIALVLSVLFWLALLVGTLGTALLWLLAIFLMGLIAQAGLIAYLKGTAVELNPQQFPDLFQRLTQACQTLGMDRIPAAFLLNGDGLFNAFATRFLGRDYLVLYSDIVDALEPYPNALNFYIGHELGHIRLKHIFWSSVLWPASLLPVLGPAYSRAREYSCDLHGLACCPGPEDACRGLAALAAGGKRWETLSLDRYAAQTAATGGFWMSLHELLGDYPWLVKRMEHLLAAAQRRPPNIPRRSLLAWLLSLFMPHVPGGAGASVGLLAVVATAGILTAVAVPAYQDYLARETVAEGFKSAEELTGQVTEFATSHRKWPSSNAEMGLDAELAGPSLQSLRLGEGGSLTLTFDGPPDSIQGKTLVLRPAVDGKRVEWSCKEGTVEDRLRPSRCRNGSP